MHRDRIAAMTVSLNRIVKTFTPLREIEFREGDVKGGIHPGRVDRFIDTIVRTSANAFTFAIIQTLLITWALLGLPYSDTPLWPIVISDAQAIVSYVFDTLLMRQLLKQREQSLRFVALLRHHNEAKAVAIATKSKAVKQNVAFEEQIDCGDRSSVYRFFACLARWTGHVGAVCLFVVAVIVWISFGPSTGFSSQWQLDMNSASSAWMVFLFSLLAVVHEQYSETSRRWIEQIDEVDVQIKESLYGQTERQEHVYLQVAKFGWWQDVILFYAHVVGGLVGVIILVAVFVVWLGIGPLLKFNDSWWLAIGTYSGLIGLFDSFVLRNVQMLIGREMDAHLNDIHEQDDILLETLGIPRKAPAEETSSLSQRVSTTVCRLSAHQMTVFGGLLVCVGLLVGASALRWSLTGQLLCNVPPSILESFLMQVLITGHLDNAKQQSEKLKALHQSRLRLLAALNDRAEVVSAAQSEEQMRLP